MFWQKTFPRLLRPDFTMPLLHVLKIYFWNFLTPWEYAQCSFAAKKQPVLKLFNIWQSELTPFLSLTLFGDFVFNFVFLSTFMAKFASSQITLFLSQISSPVTWNDSLPCVMFDDRPSVSKLKTIFSQFYLHTRPFISLLPMSRACGKSTDSSDCTSVPCIFAVFESIFCHSSKKKVVIFNSTYFKVEGPWITK